MLTVHHLNNSRSQRVLWLLEELGIDYRIERYERDPKTMFAPDALRKVHPLGKSPVITDGDITLAESGAILEYIVERYGKGALVPPAGSIARVRYTYWMHYAEGSAMPPLLLKLVFERVKSAPLPFFVKPVAAAIANRVLDSYVTPQIKNHMNYLEGELSKSPWFAGAEFSAADVQMSFPIEGAEASGGIDSERHPKLTDFLKRIHSRQAYKTALEKGGPYRLG